jgi:hypothetical protein
VWQLKKGLALPAWLTLKLADDTAGVLITHTIEAGFSGLGTLLDPLLRLYFSNAFSQAMDEHVRTEFPKLRDMLRRGGLGAEDAHTPSAISSATPSA